MEGLAGPRMLVLDSTVEVDAEEQAARGPSSNCSADEHGPAGSPVGPESYPTLSTALREYKSSQAVMGREPDTKNGLLKRLQSLKPSS
eukprot:scaffold128506_cov46-Prasinocladus_malaysianus.AAC.1